MANTSRKSRFSTALSAHWMPSSNNVRKVTSENYPTDAGREGEAIFRRVYALAGSKLPIRRLWISSMEDAAIQQGFENLRDGAAYDNLFAASECRAKADWLIGMNGTRAFTKKYGRKQTIGRVQTPTLAMLAERQAQIQNFVKEPYYKVELSGAGVVAVSEQMAQEQDADAMQAVCDGQCAVVGSIERKRVERKPPKLYDLTTLQREANRYYGLTASQTLQAAQELYEEKLVTYAKRVSELLGSKLLEKKTALGKVEVSGFPREQWVSQAMKLWKQGENVYLSGQQEDGTHAQTKYFRREEYLPVNTTIELDDREFRVDSVDFGNGTVSLQDMTLAKEVRYPIFRTEQLE